MSALPSHAPSRNSTLRHTSATCRAKFTVRVDHHSFFLVCGIGENQQAEHPPLHSNEIRNCKRFLEPSAMENVAAMSVANIPPSQAAIFTKTRTGQVFTRHQMAYVQGFTRKANELMKDVDSSSTMADSSPADNVLIFTTTAKQKNFADKVPRLHELMLSIMIYLRN